jgi:hypothetical protein
MLGVLSGKLLAIALDDAQHGALFHAFGLSFIVRHQTAPSGFFLEVIRFLLRICREQWRQQAD